MNKRGSKNISIQKLRKGDKSEFEKIYLDLFDVLYALCFQYTRRKTVSEEMVQDAFLRLWEVKAGLVENTNVKNFLYTVIKNNCLNYLRNQQIVWKHLNQVKAKEHYYATKMLDENSESFIEFIDLQYAISKVIEKLPEEQKLVFKLSRVEEMKYKEIADKLEISVKTVESRISKALKILREELQDYLTLFILFTTSLIKFIFFIG